jgi:multimeric flavodoxin WrbA
MNETKILVLLGSPRKYGNSTTLAKQLMKGVETGGGKIDPYYIHELDIKPCAGCDACRQKGADNCKLHQDDMLELYPKLREADGIVFASPVYWFSVSAQTKLVIDRTYALLGPDGYKALAGKRAAVLLTYEASDPFAAGAVNAIRMFQDIFAYVGMDIVGMVYGSAHKPGEIKTNHAVMEKAFQLGKKLIAYN